MEEEVLTFLGILGFFFILLILKGLLSEPKKKKFCVLCASAFLTWVVLLTFYWAGSFFNKTIIAILIGHTSLGIYYLWEKSVKKETTIFRLPMLLSLIFLSYTLIEGFTSPLISILLGVWILFGLIYLLKTNEKFSSLAKKIVECCKD